MNSEPSEASETAVDVPTTEKLTKLTINELQRVQDTTFDPHDYLKNLEKFLDRKDTITEMDFADHFIDSRMEAGVIPHDVLAQFVNLKYLRLSNVSGIIPSLPKLTALRLIRTTISDIHSESLTNLTHFQLASNHEVRFDITAINIFSKLESIDIFLNTGLELDINAVVRSDALQRIYIMHQPSITGELRPLLHLKKLSLVHTGITSLNSNFPSLEELNLTNNPVLRYGKEFIQTIGGESHQTKLNKITIENCPLFFDESFHEVPFDHVPNLKKVLLKNNDFNLSLWNHSLFALQLDSLIMLQNNLSPEDPDFFRDVLPRALDRIELVDLKEDKDGSTALQLSMLISLYWYVINHGGRLPTFRDGNGRLRHQHTFLITYVLHPMDEPEPGMPLEIHIIKLYRALHNSLGPVLGGKTRKRRNRIKIKQTKTKAKRKRKYSQKYRFGF